MTSPSRHPNIFAIVPAAGRSRRMGRSKQLLDVGGRLMLEEVCRVVAAGDVAGVAVVTHTAVADAVCLDDCNNAFVVINDDADSEMIDSIRFGISGWEERITPKDQDGYMIYPADQPGITIEDINNCIEAYREKPERIVIATHDRRSGHPIVFGAGFLSFVRSGACDQGLRALSRGYRDSVFKVPCASVAVTRDINTPKDFDEFRRS